MLKLNDIITTKIIDINNMGNGIAKYNDFVIFVPFVLLNEEVKIRITKVNKNFAIGKVEEVLSANPNRINPPCKYFEVCGGCDFQHSNFKCQKEIKNNYLKTIFKNLKVANLKPIISKNEFNYRNKITMFVSDDYELGLYEKGTNRVVKIENCLICESWCREVIKITNKYLKFIKDENIKGFVFRVLNNSLLVTILSKTEKLKNIENYYKELKQYFLTVGISVSKIKDKVMLNYNIKNLIGDNEIEDSFNSVKYLINNGSFMQVNNEIKKDIYNYVISNVAKDETVIDAYSGAGLLTALLSNHVKQVYGIEIVKEATILADKLAKENNIINMLNINGDCSTELPKLIKNKKLKSFTIILDPPRQGCDKSVVDTILKVCPNKIIYVSCNPVTLNRDLKLLETEYKIDLIQPYDMFPQTANVESVAILYKR